MAVSDTAGDGLDADLAAWVRAVTGAVEVRAERRSGGASRVGYAVDAVLADGTVRELWLRADTGVGPQSGGTYTLRREAAVYRALGPTAVRVAGLVAVHPTAEVFLLERVGGRTWFAEVTDPARADRLAAAFMAQLGALHRLDPRGLALAELGPVRGVGEHVVDEIDVWEAQYRAQPEPDPLLGLALAWLRRHLPPDGDWPVVLVQGDTGPGNFLYDGDEVVVVTDWEMAHWGDLHDDLAWICVRDLQERFTHLPDRWRDYERASGHRVDLDRLRYFRVLAQTRCAIGTRNGLLARDSRGEMANHLIYNALHMRLLAEALAEASGTMTTAVAMADPGPPAEGWLFDVVLDDLRDHVVPELDGFAQRRAKGVVRLVKAAQAEARWKQVVARYEADELAPLLGRGVEPTASAVVAARTDLAAAIDAGRHDEAATVVYCLRHEQRVTQVLAPALGALAGRHYSPIE